MDPLFILDDALKLMTVSYHSLQIFRVLDRD